ncbi:MAG: DUF4388 domain-containing protein [Proteobacteria bacterium]|nr:DUF4388 domain-containing protein [Pseudomonadota bacterium]
MRGAISTMPAEDVLEWVASRRLTAPVTFQRDEVQRSLVVEDGAIVWASSSIRNEQLGAILVKSGRVTERALADALETRAETGVPLGKVLVMSGLISEVELVEILATKIRETVTEVQIWTDGTFEVVPRPQPPATGVSAQLPIEICLTVARRRATRMAEIMALLGDDSAMFYIPPTASAPAPGPAGAALDLPKVWMMAGDRYTAGDIATAFSGERFATFDALTRMIADGLLVLDRRQSERTNSAVELAAGARGRLRAGDRAGALAMATKALEQDPSDAEVRRTFTQAERARVAEVARGLLARHRVPKKLREPTPELKLTESELELARRVDGRWDLLSLVRSSTLREAEALLAFTRLAEVGVVELG